MYYNYVTEKLKITSFVEVLIHSRYDCGSVCQPMERVLSAGHSQEWYLLLLGGFVVVIGAVTILCVT